MFDSLSSRYDLMNDLLDLGHTRLWRHVTVKAIDPKPGQLILDLAAGTATSSAAIAKSGARVVAADFSRGMLEVARSKHGSNGRIEFVEADAMHLPFEGAKFDATTISFGLRNVAMPRMALDEMFRVTKPGGSLVIAEFSHPTNAAMRSAYQLYSSQVIPRIAKLVARNSDAYDYLNESIAAWPGPAELSRWIREAGFRDVRHRMLTGGIVAIHKARKPAI